MKSEPSLAGVSPSQVAAVVRADLDKRARRTCRCPAFELRVEAGGRIECPQCSRPFVLLPPERTP